MMDPAMSRFSPEDVEIFLETVKTIAENAEVMIQNLNENWKILGVDNKTRRIRTKNLVAFVQERYDEVVEETEEKVKSITEEIEKLYDEFTKLIVCLNVNAKTSYKKEETLISQREVLEKDLEGLRLMLKVRTQKISNLNDWQKKLYRLLGCPQKSFSEYPLPSEEAVKNFEIYLEEQQKEYEKRIQIFLEKQTIIKSLITELELESSDSFQRYIIESTSDDFIATDSNMARLTIVHDSLFDLLESRKTEILEMRERLAMLWERLEEPASFRATFLAQYPGHSRTTEEAINNELERCEEKKRQSFKQFIGKIRHEIKEMWDSCFYSSLQRDKFAAFYCDKYDEDVLVRHEEYLEGLNKFYNKYKHIFELYKERQKLWLKWKELEEKSNEPGRFNNRGGQLLREEKERKIVSNQLPKIEKELSEFNAEYESETGMPFMINGRNLVESMQDDWNKKNEERQHKLSARKQRAAPTTPMSVPRSAPAAHRILPLMNKDTLTAVKRRLSPRSSPHTSKASHSLVRRLHFTPSTPGTPRDLNRSRSKSGKSVPVLAVNGCILKTKKKLGRLSQESKGKRRSRKSRSQSPSRLNKSQRRDIQERSISSYSDFQEHLNSDATARSSAITGRILRSHNQKDGHKYQPDGQSFYLDDIKENLSPAENITVKEKYVFNGKSNCTPSNKGKENVQSETPDLKLKNNINVFATPLRPAVKSNKSTSIQRQNTVTLASPSVHNSTRPLRRSNSSHNLRTNTASPYMSPKIQFTSKMRLII